MIYKTLCLLALATLVLAANPEDFRVIMPGWPEQDFKTYSGYLNATDRNISTFFVFLESQSSPATDPLILWLNGGPGCTSMMGLLQEVGPFVLSDFAWNFSDTINPYSWNQKANLLFFESPAGVGFSQNYSKIDQDDPTTGASNQANLKAFFDLFESQRNRTFWVTGESYAGMYIPYLASAVLEGNKNASVDYINLVGVMIGNGVLVTENNLRNDALMFQYEKHQLFGPETDFIFNNQCNIDPQGAMCNYANTLAVNVLNRVNPYDIYGQCEGNQSDVSAYKDTDQQRFEQVPWHKQNSRIVNHNKGSSKSNSDNENLENYSNNRFSHDSAANSSSNNNSNSSNSSDPNSNSDAPCTDFSSMQQQFNNQTVKEILHVNQSIIWQACSDPIFQVYKMDPRGSYWILPELMAANVSVLIQSGDADSVVSYVETERSLAKLNLTVVNEWHPWNISDQQVGGWVTEYEGLTFATVKGAGHMVPQYRPESAFAMFTRFLNGEKL